MRPIQVYLIAAIILLVLVGEINLASSKGVVRSGSAGGVAEMGVAGLALGQTTPPAASSGGGPRVPPGSGPNGRVPYVPPFKSDDDLSSMPPTGRPAIHPSLPSAIPSQPAFTTADVAQYHSTVEPGGVGGYPSSTPPALVQVQFLTERELRARIQDSTGLPDDSLLCLAQYRGSFLLIRPPGFGPSAPVGYAFEVFNARTGNLMMEGIGPNLR